ncbi:FadR family transcriptional regulator [Ochrobactrum soli]|uniref:FadR family transcriptional regulator n=1 Tax=Ochrobactrum soli TaxID=2448455 RepID=A0A849KEI2_9HYPH|nr:FadR/GntR family transcriptional regulator [[Ochrobactrum] soli]MCI1000438.1 FadR family transcriptional regulator [Ochrobactrum sp. C6C9]NNU59995.1 FadR family transcriptional regulator [[Ochrobactrum] soli]RLL74496.1 FadR family transcriptional regulator [[Ochrobactrum] soli]RRD26346.1 FadR family transcriptional regulator [Brucellaceae bacterium VT-16-1752]
MLETRRVYQQIADQIRALIDDGSLTAGSRLPAERELAQQLGISRPSLREALIALEIEGVIDIRSGSGIYVLNPTGSELNEQSLGESPAELMQARVLIECGLIAQCAARISEPALSELESILEAMLRDIDINRKPLEHDRRFHISLASAVGNSVLTNLVIKLFDERHSPISERMQRHTETPNTWRLAVEEHRAILTALRAKDPFAAQAAMHAHLAASERRWVED